MADFTSRKAGGVGGWTDEEEDGWRGEVAESYYLDMLRDDSRNRSYLDGIRRSIRTLASRAPEGVRVLDIGTGSGLLALMASSEGASSVTACECFSPVARCAAKCIAANKREHDITLVPKASSEMTQADMRGGERAHLLVNELYDTELLGEGVLPTLRHALQARPLFHSAAVLGSIVLLSRSFDLIRRPVDSRLVHQASVCARARVPARVPAPLRASGSRRGGVRMMSFTFTLPPSLPSPPPPLPHPAAPLSLRPPSPFPTPPTPARRI